MDMAPELPLFLLMDPDDIDLEDMVDMDPLIMLLLLMVDMLDMLELDFRARWKPCSWPRIPRIAFWAEASGAVRSTKRATKRGTSDVLR